MMNSASTHPLFSRPPIATATLGALALATLPLAASAAPAYQEPSSAGPPLAPLLLALLAAAFLVERSVELLWSYSEWILLSSGRLQASALHSSNYVKFKIGTSVLLGGAAGVGLANLFTLHLFAALQPLTLGLIGPLPANWDVLLSGLIVGVLAKPVHDTVGILAAFKTFLEGAAVHQREAAGAALADGVLKLAQSDAQNMLEVPGAGPTRLTPSYGDEEPTEKSISPTDRYLEILHRRTLL